jgi:hypothetical protein
MWFVAAMRPLVAQRASLDTAQEESDALPTLKYIVPPSSPSNFPEDDRGVRSQPRFHSATRVSESPVGVGVLSRLRYESGNDV